MEIIGDDENARKHIETFMEMLPRCDVKGIEAVTMIERCGDQAPLGRYYPAGQVGLIAIFMKWFKDLERTGTRVLLGRTLFHEVGHHNAIRVVHIEDLQLGEAYAQGFETAKFSQLRLDIPPDETATKLIID